MHLRSFLACVALILPLRPALADPAGPKSKALDFVNPVTYDISQRITVTNHDVSALDLLELNLPIPLEWPEQRVARIHTTGDRAFRLRDVHGMGLIVRSRYLTADVLPVSGDTCSLAVAYTLTRKEIRTDSGDLSSRTYQKYERRTRDFRLFTQAEKLIEVDSPDIVELAEKLGGGTEGPYRFARAAYEYVIDQTEYVSPSPSHGASECLQNGRADCGSYAALFVALCRANGVPARPVAGCWALGENQWHCWAEFLLPGVGWIPVDPTAGERGPREREYYFGNLDSNRITLAKTFNLAVDTEKGSTDLGFVQVGTWWWFPAPGSTGSRMTVEHHFRGKAASK